MWPTRKSPSLDFEITDDLEDSYDATAVVPEAIAPDPPGTAAHEESSFLDADPGAEAPVAAPTAGSDAQRSASSRAQRLALAAVVACPILTAGIGLVSIHRLSTIPGTARRIVEPGRPLLGRGFPIGRRRGPVPFNVGEQHSKRMRAQQPQRAPQPVRTRVGAPARLPTPAGSAPPHSAPATSTGSPSQPDPIPGGRGGEFVLGER